MGMSSRSKWSRRRSRYQRELAGGQGEEYLAKFKKPEKITGKAK